MSSLSELTPPVSVVSTFKVSAPLKLERTQVGQRCSANVALIAAALPVIVTLLVPLFVTTVTVPAAVHSQGAAHVHR